ncbi:hypothetical protein BJF83_21400 [Nocardiopsis sp. CNR-923]|nr:hypothetical protein BJF83_21400 [Nocardiopsis sp. CNR-923]
MVQDRALGVDATNRAGRCLSTIRGRPVVRSRIRSRSQATVGTCPAASREIRGRVMNVVSASG